MATQTGDRVNFVSVESELPQELEDGALYFVKSSQQLWLGSTLIANATNYSTDEQLIGTWLGKPLYQRSYLVNFTVPTGGDWFDTEISLDDVDYLVDVDCKQQSAVWHSIDGINNANILNLTNNSSRNLSVDSITIQYTKTTDI